MNYFTFTKLDGLTTSSGMRVQNTGDQNQVVIGISVYLRASFDIFRPSGDLSISLSNLILDL